MRYALAPARRSATLAMGVVTRVAWPWLQRRGEATTWDQRWRAPAMSPGPVDLWLHTPSLGELVPFSAWLERAATTRRVGVTVTSGRSLAAVRQRCSTSIDVRPLPLPLSPAMDALLSAWRPQRLILLEADAWPDLVLGAVDRGATLAVLGGRSSSLQRVIWRRFAADPRRVSRLCGIWARDTAAAAAYRAAGLPEAKVHSDYLAKLADLKPTAPAPEYTTLARPLLVVGSLHPGEAALIAQAAATLARRRPDLRWLVVPRHVERSNAVATAFTSAGLDTAIWPAQSVVTIVPQYGVLAGLYGLADAAVVGGAWVRHGGHNPAEAVIHGVPVVMGPHHHNQAALLAALPRGAVRVATGPTQLVAALEAALALPVAERAAWPAALAARAAATAAATHQAFAL